ncbi:lipopolysaccharide kinase InaA family protein [Pseudomonas sp. RIT-PI-S]|uniref:lipopolysaccharide kinase InaA family protein n=1 Tax=Pseudomonas sp. RIT-PI-S TaxID=3035295 RepID=UPI0021D9676C|nr:lipopolysaccharide kinase InaA family protein [Pseudomonas sp. RIT-PI-S]
MSLQQLARAGRTPALPLSLTLADAAGPAQLQLLTLLRVLPGQRYVGAGVWRGRAVLAKLLVGPRAARQFQREREGARLLSTQGLATPTLLAEGLREGEGGWLLFEFLQGAENLATAWAEIEPLEPLADAQTQVLGEALQAIAGLHAKGLWQEDLHLDNLLRCGGRVYVVDGGGVRAEQPGQPLSRQRVLENLGVFFAQLPQALSPFIEELLVYYLLANSEHALPLEALEKQIAKVRAWRLRDLLAKAGRDCTLFSVSRGPSMLRAIPRDEEAAILPVLANADQLIEHGHLYKTGGAATVAKVNANGRPLLIKRYNIKGVAHWFKRFWRPSRAWHSWIEAQRLGFLGIATPRPLGVLEHRTLGLRGSAYLITEHLQGPDLMQCFSAHVDDAQVPEAQLEALDRLFASLIRERISHGDMKAYNLFWERGQWSMIDLDAMQQYSSQASFIAAYGRDRARFLRNWPASSALYQRLDERLPRL